MHWQGRCLYSRSLDCAACGITDVAAVAQAVLKCPRNDVGRITREAYRTKSGPTSVCLRVAQVGSHADREDVPDD